MKRDRYKFQRFFAAIVMAALAVAVFLSPRGASSAVQNNDGTMQTAIDTSPPVMDVGTPQMDVHAVQPAQSELVQLAILQPVQMAHRIDRQVIQRAPDKPTSKNASPGDWRCAFVGDSAASFARRDFA